MRTMLAVTMAVFLGSALLLAHGSKSWPVPEQAKRRKNPVPTTAASLREGKGLYQGNCLLCHGEKGAGDGPWVEKLLVKPADLTDKHMMSEMTDGAIFWKISTGRDPMPGFEKTLSEEQRWHLVNYLRSFARKAPGTKGRHSR